MRAFVQSYESFFPTSHSFVVCLSYAYMRQLWTSHSFFSTYESFCPKLWELFSNLSELLLNFFIIFALPLRALFRASFPGKSIYISISLVGWKTSQPTKPLQTGTMMTSEHNEETRIHRQKKTNTGLCELNMLYPLRLVDRGLIGWSGPLPQ